MVCSASTVKFEENAPNLIDYLELKLCWEATLQCRYFEQYLRKHTTNLIWNIDVDWCPQTIDDCLRVMILHIHSSWASLPCSQEVVSDWQNWLAAHFTSHVHLNVSPECFVVSTTFILSFCENCGSFFPAQSRMICWRKGFMKRNAKGVKLQRKRDHSHVFNKHYLASCWVHLTDIDC